MDMKKYFSTDELNILREIQDNFQSNLNRQIGNDLLRESKASHSVRYLQNVSMIVNDSVIHLKNLCLKSPIAFETANLTVDFESECLNCNFMLKDIILEAEYWATHKGTVTFKISNTSLVGGVGFYRREDSLMPLNYDIAVIPKEIETEILFCPDEAQVSGSGAASCALDTKRDSSTSVADSMVSVFWVELKELIMRQFSRIVAGNVVEYSFSELFLDEPDKFNQYEFDRVRLSNKWFDEKLKVFVDIALGVTGPPVQTNFTKDGLIYSIQSGPCSFADLRTLKRTNDASWFDAGVNMEIYALVEIPNFQFVFDECVITTQDEAQNQVKGVIRLLPDRNRIHVKFQFSKNTENRQCCVFLDLSELEFSFVEMEADPSTPDFANMQEEVMPFVVGHVRMQTEVILQKHAKYFNNLMHNSA